MIILSFYPGHNSSISLLKDGKVILNWELERYSRIKHDYGYSEAFLNESLNLCNLSIDDIDFVCCNHGFKNPYKVRQDTILQPFDIPITDENLAIPFTAELFGKKIDALAINHHLAHAACAYFTSPFKKASIVTYDGGGDNENALFADGDNNKIKVHRKTTLKNLAGWWSSLTFNNYRMPRLHEWDPGSGAGKIMGLAAYGKYDPIIQDRLLKDMENRILSETYFDKNAYAFNDCKDLSNVHNERSQNLAKTLQCMTETAITNLFNEAFNGHSENICYAGGLALNCISNTIALNNSPFENLHVPPCPNDTGLALGMALYGWHHYLENPRSEKFFSPYTGPQYQNSESFFKGSAQADHFSIEENSIELVKKLLLTGAFICIYRGRSECGPRALGNRSIIGLTNIINGRDYLNFQVKKREWYRPFAPIILDKMTSTIIPDAPSYSPYMTTSGTISLQWREKLAVVNHVDNTTRPQILSREHNPFLYQLLDELNTEYGLPALVITSFNLQEPMVETPEQAYKTFKRFPLKYLVTDSLIISKPSDRH